MRRVEEQVKKVAAITSVLLMAAAEAMAQDQQARPARRIVVSIPDRKLALMEGNKVVRIYPTAVGKPSTPSPSGSFSVVQRIPYPTWYYKGKVVGPGTANPLGTRWIGLSASGYGIHGTNVPSSIGNNASHGCIRMNNRDVEQLFEMVSVGDSVELFSERNNETDEIFGPVVVTFVGPRQPVTLVEASAPQSSMQSARLATLPTATANR